MITVEAPMLIIRLPSPYSRTRNRSRRRLARGTDSKFSGLRSQIGTVWIVSGGVQPSSRSGRQSP